MTEQLSPESTEDDIIISVNDSRNGEARATINIGQADTKTGFYTGDSGEIAITDAVVDFRNSEGAFADDSETTGSITDVIVAFRNSQQ